MKFTIPANRIHELVESDYSATFTTPFDGEVFTDQLPRDEEFELNGQMVRFGGVEYDYDKGLVKLTVRFAD